ncbi:AAA family ATPase [Glycomyces terrestris]|uniref:ABC transporter ATP-binding protein n=1 Tax=Glycomyces terrestris TaxID=2493553 RepID=A0A426UWG6_9ACTN|nr:AAA family ATPase [Glycomyces terrestris]RRR98677.1 ABC transporter ATP-binding protein [Glycomyces terrestris]
MAGPFLRSVRAEGMPESGWPWDLPAVRALEAGLDLDAPVVMFCGDNGTGKSTLVEALADALGFNVEGGSRNFRFATARTATPLAEHLVVARRAGRRPADSFFLRAESFFNVATEIERLGAGWGAYGGTSAHERSHGEGFLDLVVNRFGGAGLYLLDEPESALSVHGCLALLARIASLTAQGSQFIVATHSPILLACPGAVLYEAGGEGIAPVAYDEAGPVRLTRGFLADPQRYLHHLLDGD